MRASPYAAPRGHSHWSEPLGLDGLGGAAVVTLPAPLQGLAAATQAPQAAVVLSVTARPVRCCYPLVFTHWPTSLPVKALQRHHTKRCGT